MKRAKLRGLKRNTAVALRSNGTMEDSSLLQQAHVDSELLVREYAEWAMVRIEIGSGSGAY